ncbi:iron-containing alcohol dehydrogenase [Chryseolinea lacunae]|uniref:Iron-containing alcohol dehydrogenase n=1 Tax=Chryseolinea lacunae TaxID=2801331 RepID=A0ABS1L0L9_9BACT|nr:iron-containing alcohol dehydrogenase [Chryseolinea lacunae]MBL0745240.1 iron-containing alcohol dehydrogenase [Chryseolinea lacunae]
MVDAFAIAATPQLHFGAGKLSILPSLVKTYGKKVALITGAHSFLQSEQGTKLLALLASQGFDVSLVSIAKEPTPQLVDHAVEQCVRFQPDVLVAIGGGSVLDAGKAIAAMVPLQAGVKDYLEGVGTKNHPGVKVPFVAVPTTAGTGSEATKNAVISEIGEHGFKKSLRHNKFVPDAAIVDPALTLSCPPSVTAASGVDAFTQLLESYLSTQANPVTDALAYEGLRRIAHSLLKAYREGSDLDARTDVALAAYLSGVTLANAGLGVVHGYASSIGGYFDVPHGVVCSSVMAAANAVTVRKLRATHGHDEALSKYATAGKIFSAIAHKSNDYYIDFLLDLIAQWTRDMNIPSLQTSGVQRDYYERIAARTDNKYNPIALDASELMEVLTLS